MYKILNRTALVDKEYFFTMLQVPVTVLDLMDFKIYKKFNKIVEKREKYNY